MICNNCGAEVSEGKFCEKCGAPLQGANNNQTINNSLNVCPNCGAPSGGGKFCEKCGAPLVAGAVSAGRNNGGGFFGSIQNSIGKTASNMFAIKSNYANNTVIYMVNKIPNVKEKNIKIEDFEMVFFNQGNGFAKYNQSFQVESDNFVCFYVKNVTYLNNNFMVETKSKIKCLDTDDQLNVKIGFIMTLEVEDVDLFFNTFTSIRQDSWREVDVNSHLSSNLKGIINKNTIEMLEKDGNLDLRDPKAQFSAFTHQIRDLILDEVKKYGLKVNTFSVNSVNIDMQEVNRILIENLYKNQ